MLSWHTWPHSAKGQEDLCSLSWQPQLSWLSQFHLNKELPPSTRVPFSEPGPGTSRPLFTVLHCLMFGIGKLSFHMYPQVFDDLRKVNPVLLLKLQTPAPCPFWNLPSAFRGKPSSLSPHHSSIFCVSPVCSDMGFIVVSSSSSFSIFHCYLGSLFST